MKRLNKKNLNSLTTHIQKPLDWFDQKRFKLLEKEYRGGKWLDLGSYNTVWPWAETINWVPDQLPFKDNTFSYVTAGQLLEHVNCPYKLIREAIRVLQKGGTFALSVSLNETHLGEVDKTYHIWSFSERDIILLLKPYGGVKTKIIRSQYLPKYKYHFPHIVAWCKKQ